MTSATYQVTGMSCEHCMRAVTSPPSIARHMNRRNIVPPYAQALPWGAEIGHALRCISTDDSSPATRPQDLISSRSHWPPWWPGLTTSPRRYSAAAGLLPQDGTNSTT